VVIDIGAGLVNKGLHRICREAKKVSGSQEFAETTALSVLAWLAANESLLPVFQRSTGASADDLRAGARDPVFLGMVLDFVMMDDAWVVEACDAQGLAYDALLRARQGLPGGAETNWT
jgi:hypothetical protein